MAEYTRVYDHDGIPFDVPEHLAPDLILNQGWSQASITKTEAHEADELEVVDLDDAHDSHGDAEDEDEHEDDLPAK